MEELQVRLASVTASEYQKILYDRITAAIDAYVKDRNRWLDAVVQVCFSRSTFKDIGAEIEKYNVEVKRLDIQIDELIQLRRTLW